MQPLEYMVQAGGKSQKKTKEYRKGLQKCTRLKEEFIMAEMKEKISKCTALQYRRLQTLCLITPSFLLEIKEDKKAQQVQDVRDWVNQFERDFWLGNSAKTLSDIGLLPFKKKTGLKRGKKSLSL